jgi:23S rRNA pseudouridine1911/1915/1917 synthase
MALLSASKKPKVNILYQNNDLLVVDKPAGMMVHAGKGREDEPSVVDVVRKMVKDTDPLRPGIVHRLDRDTSGVMVIARNAPTKSFLQSQFKARSVQKVYVALVVGKLKLKEAILDWPIGRSPKNPLKKAIKPGGKPAQTYYKVIKEFSGFTLLELKPKTGRTHQIRVQLAHLGHPIVGDALYGKIDPKLNRHFLHAARLTLTGPDGTRRQHSSPLPSELKDLLNRLLS